MHWFLEVWSIVTLFLNTSHSFRCSAVFWNNCTCEGYMGINEIYCPVETNQIGLIMTKKNNYATLICENKSIGYIDLLPRIDIFQFKRFKIDRCNISKGIYNILNKLNVTTVKNLSIENIYGTVKINKEIFKSLQSLEGLTFSYSKFNFNNEFLKNTPNLTGLTMNDVGLSDIFMNFEYTPKLRLLQISMNQINSISDGTFKRLHKLTELSLDSNNISTITKKLFVGLNNLQLLELSRNKIERLGKDAFADLINLKLLSLMDNKIKELRATDFRKCKELEELFLQLNQIIFLPDEVFKGLERLKILDVSFNNLTSLTQNIFATLVSLETLTLSHNKLLVMNMNIFKNLNKLKQLTLHNNMISNVVQEVYFDLNNNSSNNNNNLFNGVIVDLSYNHITEYPKIQGLKINKLKLSFNRIDYIRVNNSISWPIMDIDLHHNKIKHVDFRVDNFLLEKILNVSINLENNPVECDCSNYDLIRYNNGLYENLRTRIKIGQEGLVCWSNKTKLLDLKPADISCPLLYDCPSPCNCSYKPFNGDITVNCSSKNLTTIPLSIKNYPNLSTPLIDRQDAVQYLDLSDNLLNEIDWIPEFIKEINLNGNRIKNFNRNSIMVLKNCPTLKRLHLKNNPWECNCQSMDFQKYLMEHYTEVNSSDVYCQNEHNELISIKIICPTFMHVFSLLAYVFGILICFAISFAIYYRYQKQIGMWLFKKQMCLWMISEEELDKDKKYDVFISYAAQDEKFVIDELLIQLETGDQPFKVCIHVRDWIPGEFISRQIYNSVKDSRRTIVILSNNFLESIWGNLEFRIAHSEAVSEGRSKLIIVKYGDVVENNLSQELKHYLKTNTYIEWGDPHFWKKIYNALSYHRNKKTKMKLQFDDIPIKNVDKSNNLIILDRSRLDWQQSVEAC